MKKFIYFLFIIIIVAAIAFVLFFDKAGKTFTRSYLQATLNNPVTIETFDIDIFDKAIDIKGIAVQNPPNFNHRNAFSIGKFRLQINSSVFADLIIIDELAFDGIDFTLEQKNSSVNLSNFIDNLKKSNNNASSQGDGSTNDKRVIIKKFSVSNIKLNIDTKWLKKTIAVPNIIVKDFGGGSGIAMNAAGKELMKIIFTNMQNSLKKIGIEAGKEEIKETIKRKITEKLGLQEDKIKKLKENFNDKAEDIGKKAGDLLKKLGL